MTNKENMNKDYANAKNQKYIDNGYVDNIYHDNYLYNLHDFDGNINFWKIDLMMVMITIITEISNEQMINQ